MYEPVLSGLVNDPHLFFIHSAAMHRYCGQGGLDLTKIRRH
jgi:hypothetical protein